ncbi:unnamed protein product, partial [Staurois parvus]
DQLCPITADHICHADNSRGELVIGIPRRERTCTLIIRALMICVASAVPPVSVHQCLSAHQCPCQYPSVPHQCHISVPTSAHHATYQCPSELPFSVTHQYQSVPISASQCHLSVPVSAAYQCCLSVPCISTAFQCPSVMPVNAHQCHLPVPPHQ